MHLDVTTVVYNRKLPGSSDLPSGRKHTIYAFIISNINLFSCEILFDYSVSGVMQLWFNS